MQLNIREVCFEPLSRRSVRPNHNDHYGRSPDFGLSGLRWILEMPVGVTFLNVRFAHQCSLYSRITSPAQVGQWKLTFADVLQSIW